MEYNLLEKTELWLTGVRLDGVNLAELAAAAAEILALDPAEVMVVDVRENLVTLDILRKTVRAEDVAGKQAALLERFSAVPGLELAPQAAIHSEGVLGVIALDPAEVDGLLERTQKMTRTILANVARRAIVYSSGFEVRRGMIQDTNCPLIKETLEQQGFRVTIGPVLEDDEYVVSQALDEAVSRAYGLVITTGGVGAEDKDRTVEGLLRVDPGAATAWLVKYEQGQGRHEKEGVRIAVGQVGPTTIITLPGPNDEVRTALPVICRRLAEGDLDKRALVEEIAAALRAALAAKMKSWPHHHHS